MAAKEKSLDTLYAHLWDRKLHQDLDSIELLSKQFTSRFTALIQSSPATLSHPFTRLTRTNDVYVVTSADSLFRIYSWDTQLGGSMHDFRTIYQWKDKGQVFTRQVRLTEGDPGSFSSKIFTAAVDGKPYYLAISNSIYSGKGVVQSVSVFAITGGKLTDTAKLFHTKTQRLNRIDVDFDFFSVVDRPERPVELIAYDEKRRIVYIAVVDEKGVVTERNILYQLKGSLFEFIGIEKGKRK